MAARLYLCPLAYDDLSAITYIPDDTSITYVHLPRHGRRSYKKGIGFSTLDELHEEYLVAGLGYDGFFTSIEKVIVNYIAARTHPYPLFLNVVASGEHPIDQEPDKKHWVNFFTTINLRFTYDYKTTPELVVRQFSEASRYLIPATFISKKDRSLKRGFLSFPMLGSLLIRGLNGGWDFWVDFIENSCDRSSLIALRKVFRLRSGSREPDQSVQELIEKFRTLDLLIDYKNEG